MKFQLKNVEHSARLSEETTCFSADIWMDGKKVATASNRGQGGCTDIHPWEFAEKLNAYAKTLPRKTSNIKDKTDPSGFFTYEQSAESLVEDALHEILLERELKAKLRNKILYTAKDKPGVFQVSANKATLNALMTNESYRARSFTALGADKILNVIPLPEAVSIYRAGTQ